jgi:thymidylate kinase
LRPDLTVFLSIPVEVGMKRFSGRATRERFEENHTQLEQIVERYDAAMAALRAGGEEITVIDGAREPAEVHAEIAALASAVLAPRYPRVAVAPR